MMINEHDLADWEVLPTTPLYSVPNKRYIKYADNYYWFDHIDGMYSFCTTLSGDVFHLAAFADVNELRKKD